MALPTRIYLTGFMASGKSTVGPILANVLGYAHADLDARIEAQVGRPIPAYFAEAGEAAFRRAEAEALTATTREERLVVATGGGALTREANLALALAHGAVVYLYVEPERLARRLQRTAAQRPLLHGADGQPLPPEALRRRVFSLLEARAPFYERAHLTIDTTRQRLGHTVDAVAQQLRSWDR
ncbi:MAG: shikimate kinase [Bacteroidota bacterium]